MGTRERTPGTRIGGALAGALLLAPVASAAAAGVPGAAYLLPPLVLALVLIASRRYPGERALSGALEPSWPRARARGPGALRPRSRARLLARGGELIASCLAERPPPPTVLPQPVS